MNDSKTMKLSKTLNISKTAKLVLTGLLMAVVIILQLFASSITIGTTSFSLVLIPIVLGAMILGPISGAVLGLTFGIVVVIAGLTGADMFTNILLNTHPIITTLLCLGKGAFAGLGAGLIYKLLSNRVNPTVVSFISAGAAPIINTGLFILGGLFMSGTLAENFVDDGQTVMYFLIIGCAGINFLVEFAVNMIFAPALAVVVRAVAAKKH